MARSTLIYEATVRLWRMGDTVNPLARLKVLGPLLRPIFRPEENQAIIIPVRESVDDGRSASLPVEILAAFIAQAEHIAVLSHCICRQSLGCDTHDARLGCMFLGEGAARIDRSLGRQVDRTEAIAHVQRAVDARLTPTVLHSVVDAILLQIPFRRMLAVCFCCDCCCTIRRGMRLGTSSTGGDGCPFARASHERRGELHGMRGMPGCLRCVSHLGR